MDIKLGNCFCCGKEIDLNDYPTFWHKEMDKEICRECFEKRYGKVFEDF